MNLLLKLIETIYCECVTISFYCELLCYLSVNHCKVKECNLCLKQWIFKRNQQPQLIFRNCATWTRSRMFQARSFCRVREPQLVSMIDGYRMCMCVHNVLPFPQRRTRVQHSRKKSAYANVRILKCSTWGGLLEPQLVLTWTSALPSSFTPHIMSHRFLIVKSSGSFSNSLASRIPRFQVWEYFIGKDFCDVSFS